MGCGGSKENSNVGSTHNKIESHPQMTISASTACNATTMIENTCALGAGCYWGTEKYVKKDFQKRFPDSIKSAKVGFMSPDPNAMKDPSYRQVCSGQSGHVEVLLVELNDPDKHFQELMKFFYMFHDPTTLNRQGNDAGTQYASYVFTQGEEQARIASSVTSELQDLVDTKKITAYEGDKVSTKIGAANTFYEAHDEHQEYLSKNPNGYCNHRFRFKEWPELN